MGPDLGSLNPNVGPWMCIVYNSNNLHSFITVNAVLEKHFFRVHLIFPGPIFFNCWSWPEWIWCLDPKYFIVPKSIVVEYKLRSRDSVFPHIFSSSNKFWKFWILFFVVAGVCVRGEEVCQASRRGQGNLLLRGQLRLPLQVFTPIYIKHVNLLPAISYRLYPMTRQNHPTYESWVLGEKLLYERVCPSFTLTLYLFSLYYYEE